MDNRLKSQEIAKNHKSMIGCRYRHFKGNIYKVKNLAVHSETEEVMVVYYSESNPELVWVRPLDMFMSKVDKEKYPDVEQEYRFQLIVG